MKDADGRKGCYGGMLAEVPVRQTMTGKGKVFSFELTHPGGMGPFLRDIKVDSREWDDCRICPEFDHCYRLSLMKNVFGTLVLSCVERM